MYFLPFYFGSGLSGFSACLEMVSFSVRNESLSMLVFGHVRGRLVTAIFQCSENISIQPA